MRCSIRSACCSQCHATAGLITDDVMGPLQAREAKPHAILSQCKRIMLAHGMSRLRRCCVVASTSKIRAAAWQRSCCSLTVCRPAMKRHSLDLQTLHANFAKMLHIAGIRTARPSTANAYTASMASAHDITLRAAYDVIQLSSARVAVQCDMFQRKIHS